MVINVYAADGSGAPLTLVTASATDRVIDDLQWSPDGSHIAFLYDDETAGSFGLYAVPSDGATTELLVSQQPGADADVTSFKWSPDTSGAERFLAYTADFTLNGEFALWSVDAAATVPTPVGLVTDADLDVDEDVQATLAFDDQDRLYFKADFEQDNLFRLYRVDIDGQNRAQVPGTNLMNTGGTVEASIGSFGISAAGDRIAFSSDSPTANLYEMYVIDVASATADKVSNVTPAAPAPGDFSGPDFGAPIWWSPDGTTIAAKADYVLLNGENDGTFSLWLFPTTGMGGTRVLGAPMSTNLHVEEAVFSADSGRIYARGDLRANGDNEIFQITDFSTSDQDPNTNLHQGVVTGGDIVGFAVP
jgi:Tol biopolymer transport system component